MLADVTYVSVGKFLDTYCLKLIYYYFRYGRCEILLSFTIPSQYKNSGVAPPSNYFIIPKGNQVKLDTVKLGDDHVSDKSVGE